MDVGDLHSAGGAGGEQAMRLDMPWMNNAEIFFTGAIADGDYEQAIWDLRWLSLRVSAWIDSTLIKDEADAEGTQERMRFLEQFMQMSDRVADFQLLIGPCGALEPIRTCCKRAANLLRVNG